ncbi:DUF791-domain-containing protein [Schizopora paradoxa]|uniref:Molybdate-anion transporter n=1 Tax=Schizopora paradoxa TaxID=27342 RepID=A0A0H2RDH8_9AGAM|nr:DUF791-domain-containing protein [Schizopora paradoxa]
MSAPFYEFQLFVLATFCVAAVVYERRAKGDSDAPSSSHSRSDSTTTISGIENGNAQSTSKPGASSTAALARNYLIVYGIVMCADWLQGPYVYSLYREQYGYPERVVATLFVTGFLSAGIAAPLVGAWADQHGRRKACLAFCVTYTLACCCTLVNALPILYLGRVLGGISTSILFSAFESWLISSANANHLSERQLSSIFGRATVVNGAVAFLAGIMSNQLVSKYEIFTPPFIASGAALILAYFVIRMLWSENYGNGGGSTSEKQTTFSDPFQLKRLGKAWSIVRSDSTLLTLGLTQTCFEGSMYLFVFAWVPSLQEASYPGETLPLGYIFSAFMVSMMLGSLLYSAATSTFSSSSSSNASSSTNSKLDGSLTLHAKLSSLVCTLSACALAVSVSTDDVRKRFWAFCVFEACVGMYYPVQGMLRGALIADDHRATLSSLFRVPLNVFVVFSLMNGVSSSRLYVVAGCAVALSLSAIMTGWVVVARTEEKDSTTTHRP